VFVYVYEQDVFRRAVVVIPEVGLPKANLIERLLRKAITAVGQRLRFGNTPRVSATQPGFPFT
jgi:hypothetical protein